HRRAPRGALFRCRRYGRSRRPACRARSDTCAAGTNRLMPWTGLFHATASRVDRWKWSRSIVSVDELALAGKAVHEVFGQRLVMVEARVEAAVPGRHRSQVDGVTGDLR